MPLNAHSTTAGPLREPVQAAVRFRAAVAALGLASISLAVLAMPHDVSAGVAVARVAGVAVPVAVGLFSLAHDRADRFGLLLVGAGAVYSLTVLAESSGSDAYSIGRIAAWLIEPALIFLILAFPYGRLQTAGQRRVMAVVAVLVPLLYVAPALIAPFPTPSPWAGCGTSCPSNAFVVSSHPGLVDGFIRPLRELITVAVFAAVAVMVTRRAARSGQILQRMLIPVAVVAGARLLTLVAYFVERRVGHSTALFDAIGWVYVMSLPAITLAFAGGMLAHRLFVADALERLTETLSARPSARQLRSALAGALRDPSLEIAFCVPNVHGGWVDESGSARGRPRAAPGRAVTEVSNDGRPLAAIVHDEALSHDHALLHGITSYSVAALENQHLINQLKASLEELSASRARLVSVADDERRRIERDLHDGAQQRLVALQIKLELVAERLEVESPEDAGRVRALEDEIAATLDEVRSFGRGLYPPLLADRGLGDALHAVARGAAIPTSVDVVLPHRYPREIESAVYFACLEALQNAAKHAGGATGVRISVSGNGRLRFDVRDDGSGFDPAITPGGAGLTNVRDRIGAVGGTVEIASQPGGGTRVTGMIPLT